MFEFGIDRLVESGDRDTTGKRRDLNPEAAQWTRKHDRPTLAERARAGRRDRATDLVEDQHIVSVKVDGLNDRSAKDLVV